MGWFHKKADKPVLSILGKPDGSDEQKRGVFRASAFSVLAACFVLWLIWPSSVAVATPPPGSIISESTVYTGLALFRLRIAIVAVVGTVGAAFLVTNWFENTELGRRNPEDTGLVFAGLVISIGSILAKVVL